jgi:hypothetical protein
MTEGFGFTIRGEHEFIKLSFREVYDFPGTTSFKGGYEVDAIVEIRSGNFDVKSSIYTSTGEIYMLYQELQKWHQELTGEACYKTYEGGLELSISLKDNSGRVLIKGLLLGISSEDRFEFSFESDQSFITASLIELELIAREYGDMSGVRK